MSRILNPSFFLKRPESPRVFSDEPGPKFSFELDLDIRCVGRILLHCTGSNLVLENQCLDIFALCPPNASSSNQLGKVNHQGPIREHKLAVNI